MSNTLGATTVLSTIEPQNGADFPVANARNIRAAAVGVANTAERDALPPSSLSPGMAVNYPDGTSEHRNAANDGWIPAAGGGGGGAVDSVNGQTGVVVLTAANVGADPAGSASAAYTAAVNDAATFTTTAITNHTGAIDPHGDRAFATAAIATHAAAADPHGDRAFSANANNLTSGTVAAARMPAFTGAITTTAGSTATTLAANAVTTTAIANSAITNAKLANMAISTVKGAVVAGAPVDLTTTQLTTLINTFTSTLKGAVPASGGGTTTFLRADGTFAAPTASIADGDKGDITVSGTGSTWTIDAGVVDDTKIAAANKDGVAGTPSLRTLGTGAQQATAGNDARLSDARTPTAHAASHVDGLDRVSFFDLLRMERVGGYQGVSNQNITMNPFGAPAWNESGGTQRNIANTSTVTALQRRGYVSAATAGAAAGGRSQAILLRDLDGFRVSFAFAVTDAAPVAGARMFVGVRAATTAATDVQIDSVINAIGIGHEAGDAGFSVFHNDASGVATKVPLDPAKFPTANLSTDIIRVEITTLKASGTVRVTVTNVTLGQTETVTLSTDLPALSVGLTPTVWRSNGATALATGVDVFRILFDLGGGMP